MLSSLHLLDTLLVAALFLLALAATVRYFKTTEENFLMEGIEIGALWYLMALVLGGISVFVFPNAFMRIGTEVTPLVFFMSIGVFFLIVPMITISFGYILEKKMLAR
jgi:hypothetical protein